MKRGLLLLAHGARDARWTAPFEDLARRLRALAPTVEVRLSYLDFLPPDLATAGAELARAGCQRIDVMPLFLGAGGHVRNDVPRLVHELSQHHPQVEWVIRPTIGEVDSVIDAMARACLALALDSTANDVVTDRQ
jgi:sirohydrochlorin cobaltochelatase